jgi:CheY-like chemotaxis protein
MASLTLLLADENSTTRRVAVLGVGDRVRVVSVIDGESALARIQAEPPDLILADIGLPKRNGYDLAAFVKSDPKLTHIPVVLLAGALEPLDDNRIAACGCIAVLKKPFDPQELAARIPDWLSRKRKPQPPPEPEPESTATAATAPHPQREPASPPQSNPEPLRTPEPTPQVRPQFEPEPPLAVQPHSAPESPRQSQPAPELPGHMEASPAPERHSHPEPPSVPEPEVAAVAESNRSIDAASSEDDTREVEAPEDTSDEETQEVPTLRALLGPPADGPATDAFSFDAAAALAPPVSAVPPLPPAAPASLAEAFRSLLAVEQRETDSVPVGVYALTASMRTDLLVEEITRRVLDRLRADMRHEVDAATARIAAEVTARLARGGIAP